MRTSLQRLSVLLFALLLAFGWVSSTALASTSEDPRDTIYPAVDLGGREITVAMWWDYWPNSDSTEPSAADADFTESRLEMYNSLRRIEQKYNVKIRPKNVPYGDIGNALTTAYLANEALADIVYAGMNTCLWVCLWTQTGSGICALSFRS